MYWELDLLIPGCELCMALDCVWTTAWATPFYKSTLCCWLVFFLLWLINRAESKAAQVFPCCTPSVLWSHKHMTALYFGWCVPTKDKTVALGQKGSADTSSSWSHIECFYAPICKRKIIYIWQSSGKCETKKWREMHVTKLSVGFF